MLFFFPIYASLCRWRESIQGIFCCSAEATLCLAMLPDDGGILVRYDQNTAATAMISLRGVVCPYHLQSCHRLCSDTIARQQHTSALLKTYGLTPRSHEPRAHMGFGKLLTISAYHFPIGLAFRSA